MAVGKADQTRFCNAAIVVGFLEATRKVEPALMAQLSSCNTDPTCNDEIIPCN